MVEAMTNLQILWLDNNPLSSIPKSILKKPANVILSYVKEHPNARKSSKPMEPVFQPRNLRKSPPVVPGKSVVSHGKKDIHIIAEKELKKRKREQLEEMKKHLEVEKRVKLLEQELMIANAKAQKFEEEVRKVEEQKQMDPPPPSPQMLPLPSPTTSFAPFPPHVPRQQGVVNNTNQNTNNKSEPSSVKSSSSTFEWEIPFKELTFGPRIGRGGYGEVFRGMWGGTEVAAKMLFTDNMSAKISDLRKEVELLCKLRHPNIVLFMGACTEPETPCIVTEYLGRGNLANILLDESIEIDWGLRLQIGIDAARGMAYLHSRNPVIIHRDLKTDNLLVDDNWQVKVADFGLATVKSRTFAKTMCGTTGWVAPEVLAEEGYTEKADVYSFAIILWELLTRKIPYAGKNTMQVVRSVDRGERLAIPDYCPPEYAQLISDCWATDPAQRYSFVEVLQKMEKMRMEYLQEKANTQLSIAREVKAELLLIEKEKAENQDGNNNTANNNSNNTGGDANNTTTTTTTVATTVNSNILATINTTNASAVTPTRPSVATHAANNNSNSPTPTGTDKLTLNNVHTNPSSSGSGGNNNNTNSNNNSHREVKDFNT